MDTNFRTVRKIGRPVVTLLCIIGISIMALTLLLAVFAPKANAAGTDRWERKDQLDHGVVLTQPAPNYPSEARVLVVAAQHVVGRWYALDLADGSRWYASECEYDEINGDRRQVCYWNAHTMGNCEGTSFAVLNGKAYRVTRHAWQHDGSTCTTPGVPEAESHPMCDPPLPPHYMRTRA